jgi:hypothetical protein
MQTGSECSRASGDAAIILEMQEPRQHSLCDMHTADPPAAVCTHGSDASSIHVPAAGGSSAQWEGSSKAEASQQQQQLSSIYVVFSRRRRGLILAVVSVSQFLNPFSSSIILPSLKVGANQLFVDVLSLRIVTLQMVCWSSTCLGLGILTPSHPASSCPASRWVPVCF